MIAMSQADTAYAVSMICLLSIVLVMLVGWFVSYCDYRFAVGRLQGFEECLDISKSRRDGMAAEIIALNERLAQANRTIAHRDRADKLSAALSSNGTACPFCHCDTDDVTFGCIASIDDDDSRATKHARCGACGEEWRSVYRLSAIEDVDREDQS